MKKTIGLAGLALVLIAGAALWLSQGPTAPGQTALTGLTALADTTPATDPAKVPDVPDMVLGSPDAKVTLMEYASFTCPHCADFHARVWKDLKKDYIDTGKVKFVYREVYFDRYGLWAAMMARCGGPTRYFGIADILYDTQKDWAHTDDPNAAVENIKRIGRTAGMNDDQLMACLIDGAMARAMVTNYQTKSTADNVEGTPTLFINGEKHTNMQYSELKTLLDAALAK